MNTEEPQSDAWLLRYVQNQIIKKIFIETNVSHNTRGFFIRNLFIRKLG